MKPCTLRIACLCSVLTLVIAAPVPDPLPGGENQELDVLQIPLSNGKEIDVLTLGTKDQEELIAERNKRTIGLLRELFPDITKQIDSIVNRIIAQVIRVAGPDLLRSVLSNRPTTQRPNLASDFDDDDDEDDDSNGNDFRNDNDADNSNNINKVDSDVTTAADNGSSGSRIKIDLPTFAPDVNGSPTNSPDNEGATDTQIDLSAINKQLEETIRVARQVQEAEAAAQAAAAAMQQDQQAQEKSDTDTIQLSFNNEVSPESNNGETSNINNNELPSGESPAPALDDLTLDDDTVDLDDRNKRFLTGGGGILSGNTNNNAGGNAGAAGSGNFLFDIVRLFSGSVQAQAGGATANSVSSSTDSDGDSDANRAQDGFTEGIPGPVTRLVVLANRGLANLIQDLILRVAATSEKFVNFKAKLITALI